MIHTPPHARLALTLFRSPMLRRVALALALIAGALTAMATLTAAAEPDVAALIRNATARYPEDKDARRGIVDAFVAYEQSELHNQLGRSDPTTYREVELGFFEVLGAMASGAPAADVRAKGDALIERLASLSGTRASAAPSSLFVDSLLIIVREGFEAILILTALAAYLVKVGQPEKRRLLYVGAGAAVAASFALAAIADRLLPVSGAAREALEGITMLIAVVVLFFASYWLISKAEAQHWQAFVKHRLEGALGSGRGAALVLLAFLVVFREGFETVLFYQALGGRAGGTALGLSAVGLGFAVGVVVLVGIAIALFRYGVRIPVRPFFAVTGALLYVLAFKFAGAGVRELQEAGWVSTTPAPVPDVGWLRDWLAVYPFVEPLAAQGVLIVALVAGFAYVALTRAAPEVGGPQAARP